MKRIMDFKVPWDVVITIGGLLALMFWADPQIEANPVPRLENDNFTNFIEMGREISLSGQNLLIALVGLGLFAWFVFRYEGEMNGCVGPLVMLAMAGSLIAFSIYGG